MTRNEQLEFLIQYISPEAVIPQSENEKFRLFRALVNVREPLSISDDFIRVQDSFLQDEISRKGVTDIKELTPIKDNIYLWKGDITTLKCDAIVNAANSKLLGCFVPCHRCIDNAIHTFAGIQLRQACYELMQEQGHNEPTGKAKITPAYNLPCGYVLHTVGPIVSDKLTQKHCDELANCYRSCLVLATKKSLESIAFCFISTGEFCFPKQKAAEIALNTVSNFLSNNIKLKRVIFNVFTDEDYLIYNNLLSEVT